MQKHHLTKYLYVLILLTTLKTNSLADINPSLLDSARKYCSTNRSFDKTNFFLNQIISVALKTKIDTILAEAYYIKALNYFYEGNNYHKDELTNTFKEDWGIDCEYCKPELFYKACGFYDSVVIYLPYSYSRYKKLYNDGGQIVSDVDASIKEMVPYLTKKDLKLSKQKNTLFLYLLLLAALIIGLIIYFLIVNRRKNIKIKSLLENLEHKNQDIIDSITYAKRIQDAFMTSVKYIDKTLTRLQDKK